MYVEFIENSLLIIYEIKKERAYEAGNIISIAAVLAYSIRCSLKNIININNITTIIAIDSTNI